MVGEGMEGSLVAGVLPHRGGVARVVRGVRGVACWWSVVLRVPRRVHQVRLVVSSRGRV